MRIKFNYYIPNLGKHDTCVAYFKAGKWRIYNYGSDYSVKNQQQANDLLQEVAGEMHVAFKNIKLVRATYIDFKEVWKNNEM